MLTADCDSVYKTTVGGCGFEVWFGTKAVTAGAGGRESCLLTAVELVS